MIFWIVAGLLAFAVVLAMLWPLLATAETSADRSDYDLSVYRDQLAELSRDRDAGRLSDAEHRAARTEVERRMLAAGREVARGRPAGEEPVRIRRLRRLFVALVTVVALPAGTVAVYVGLGSPGQSDLPLASRASERVQSADAGQHEQGVQEMVDQLRRRLEADPEDGQGWRLLGRSYMIMGRYGEAADALGRAIDLNLGDPRVRAEYAEALVLAAGGTVTPEAERAFRRVHEAMPGEPRARFYIGQAAFQEGLYADALDWWVELEADTPVGAPWEAMLAERIDAAGVEAGVDVAARRAAALSRRPDGRRPPPPPEAAAGRRTAQTAPPAASPSGASPSGAAPSGAAPARGPSAEDMAAAQQMSPDERQQMIRGMVEGLAARLERQPDDLQGWIRLARSYSVLGEPDKATEALGRAAGLAPDDIDLQMQYARALFPDGTPTERMPEAFKRVVRGVLARQPDHPEAMFLGGMVAAADGDSDRAIELWQGLLDRMGPNAPARPMLEQRIRDLGG